MRLIDADKIDYIVEDEEKPSCLDYVRRSHIADEPTVEAIPIEWLEKKAKMYDDLAERIGGMWGEIYGDWAHLLRQLAEKWRKENEID